MKKAFILMMMFGMALCPAQAFAGGDEAEADTKPKAERIDLGGSYQDNETIGYGDQEANTESAEDVRSFGDPFDDANEPVVGPIDAGE